MAMARPPQAWSCARTWGDKTGAVTFRALPTLFQWKRGLMTSTMAAPMPRAWDALTDEEVVERVLAGEGALFEVLMRRYNQRLYRVARAILRDDGEADDVMQQAY